MLRVGIKPDKGNLKIDGYETINVLMKSHSKWGALGPYHLKTEKGEIFDRSKTLVEARTIIVFAIIECMAVQ